MLMAFTFLYLAVGPKAHAVIPPPDGGYPGFNTAEGQNALRNLSTGVGNTAAGWYSLFSNTDGSFNTAVGAGTLILNIGDQTTGEGLENTAVGTAALLFNSTGSENTAVGSTALESNTTGLGNTAHGVSALTNNTTGGRNTATGVNALFFNTTGSRNTAVGANTLVNNTGATNTAVGDAALFKVTTGSGNIALGADAGSAITANNNVICIGAPGPATVSDACFIGHIFGTTSSGGTAVFINSDGRLGTTTSSRRFKEEIKPMERSSEALYALKPVTFRYKKEFDPQGILQFGLVAEEVEAVNPDLVVRDKEGKPYSVRYDQVNAMLLNEVLKEHKKVEAQQTNITQLNSKMASQAAIIAQQQKGMEALTSQLKEQAAQIQKVSAQLEVSKPAPQVVNYEE